MAYLGNSPVLSQQEYRNIDNISGSFNGVTTSFPLLVNGVAPVPAPQSSNQCLISVNGVVQKPDDTGASGFRLSGGNIVFSAAPTGGQSFFGVILAGADYIYAGSNFPDGTVTAPSITFVQDLDTGFYRSGAGEVKFTANGANAITFSANNLTAPSFIPTSSTVPTNGTYLSAANQLSFATNTTERLRLDASGQIEAVSLGTAAAPTYSFTTDPNTGIYSPGADQVAISTNGSGRLFVDSSGRIGIQDSAPSTSDVRSANVVIGGATSDGIGVKGRKDSLDRWYVGYNSSDHLEINQIRNNQLVFKANNTEYARITNDGKLGLGTSSPSTLLHIQSTDPAFRFKRSDAGTDAYGELTTDTSGLVTMKCDPANAAAGSGFRITVDNSEALRVDSSGRLGIGTTSPNRTLTLYDSSTPIIQLINSSSGTTSGSGSQIYRSSTGFVIEEQGALPIQFLVNGGSERARIDSSGRLLVGTSTARGDFFNTSNRGPSFQVEGTTTNTSGVSVTANLNNDNGPEFNFGKSRGTNTGSSTIVSNGDGLGRISFQGADGLELVPAAYIEATVDGTPGANDMPGRLVFSTTADGASSPTERMRIANDGSISSVIPGGSTLYPRFGCRAWVNFNGTGTVAIRGSGNVSSITDNGTGDYTVNFTTAMVDANYGVAGITLQDSSLGDGIRISTSTTYSASLVRLNTFRTGDGVLQDKATVSIAIFR